MRVNHAVFLVATFAFLSGCCASREEFSESSDKARFEKSLIAATSIKEVDDFIALAGYRETDIKFGLGPWMPIAFMGESFRAKRYSKESEVIISINDGSYVVFIRKLKEQEGKNLMKKEWEIVR